MQHVPDVRHGRQGGQNEDDNPFITQVNPDKDILKLGLPSTTLVGPGNVPRMFLLLKGAHYDLAVPKQTIKDKFISNESDGDSLIKPPKSTQERLQDLEDKYSKLKVTYGKALKIIETL